MHRATLAESCTPNQCPQVVAGVHVRENQLRRPRCGQCRGTMARLMCQRSFRCVRGSPSTQISVRLGTNTQLVHAIFYVHFCSIKTTKKAIFTPPPPSLLPLPDRSYGAAHSLRRLRISSIENCLAFSEDVQQHSQLCLYGITY